MPHERIQTLREKRSEVLSSLKNQEALIKRNKDKLKEIEELKVAHVKAIGVIDKAIQIISANGIGKIESVVSDGLKLVFDDDLKLVIERREGTKGDSYRLLVKKGDIIGNPIDTFGGGVVNVISFLLRVIMIQRFKLSKFMALDESFNNVSAEYVGKISQMIKTLCDDYGYTVLSVTHQSVLAAAADRVFTVDEGPNLRELRSEELDELRSSV